MENGHSAKVFGLGLLAGAVAGGIVGILYAPHSGRVTRDMIDDRVHEAKHKAERIIEDAKDEAAHILREARAKVRG